MVPTPIDQEAVFFNAEWTREIEDEFLSQLVDEALLGTWEITGGNANAIRKAMREINYRFNREFDFKYCRARVGKLKNRYRVFKWITSLSAVAYDESSKKVSCSMDAWEFICEKERLGACYMLNGEKHYDWLKCLFELSSVDIDEVPPDVINIPSDEDPNFEVPIVTNVLPTAVDNHF